MRLFKPFVSRWAASLFGAVDDLAKPILPDDILAFVRAVVDNKDDLIGVGCLLRLQGLKHRMDKALKVVDWYDDA